MKTLLVWFTGFDWTTLPRFLAQAFALSDGHNPLWGAHAFRIDGKSRWAGGAVHRLLKRKGIPSWGNVFGLGEYSFQVPKSKAQLAQGLMQKVGVPLLGV